MIKGNPGTIEGKCKHLWVNWGGLQCLSECYRLSKGASIFCIPQYRVVDIHFILNENMLYLYLYIERKQEYNSLDHTQLDDPLPFKHQSLYWF